MSSGGSEESGFTDEGWGTDRDLASLPPGSPEPDLTLDLGPLPDAAPQDDLPWPPWLENLSDRERVTAIVSAVANCYASTHGDGDPAGRHCTASMAERFLLKLISPATPVPAEAGAVTPFPFYAANPEDRPDTRLTSCACCGPDEECGECGAADAPLVMPRDEFRMLEAIKATVEGSLGAIAHVVPLHDAVDLLVRRCEAAESEVMRLKGVTVLPGMPGAEL